MSNLSFKFSDEDVRLLTAIADEGITRGSVAMERAELTPDQMVKSVARLLRAELINAEGQLNDPVMIAFSTLSTIPSKLAFIQHHLQRA